MERLIRSLMTAGRQDSALIAVNELSRSIRLATGFPRGLCRFLG
jgi:hypothetical protein